MRNRCKKIPLRKSIEYGETLKQKAIHYQQKVEIFQKQPPDVFCQKRCLEIWQNSQENTCARVSYLIKLQTPRAATLLKKRLWHRCFPVNFAKFLRTSFLQSTYGRLLLMFLVSRLATCWELGFLFGFYQGEIFLVSTKG